MQRSELEYLLRASDEALRQRYRQNGLAAAGHYDRKELALRMLAEIEACR